MNVVLVTGVDILHVPRMAAAIERYGERLLQRLFTWQEQRYCSGRAERLAARFAAKEAVGKALGVGMRTLAREGVGWHEVEVVNDDHGQPTVRLYGHAAALAQQRGVVQWALSLAHEREYAIAVAVGLGVRSL
ncbi:MAG: holo-ACP synthase [Thermoflexales bacterium]|nr:holo-ACP synthase [Thermoflexales bacterium]MDW8293409.1 holo-ACP synthase [Anaerolineae bacterium]